MLPLKRDFYSKKGYFTLGYTRRYIKSTFDSRGICTSLIKPLSYFFLFLETSLDERRIMVNDVSWVNTTYHG